MTVWISVVYLIENQQRHNDVPIGELGFLNNLDITENEIEVLSQDPEFKYVSPQDRLKSNNDKLAKSLKKIESKNFSDTRNHIKSQINIPKVSTTQRDLSKFFPKKEEKATSSNVNKNQKELKDVNLAKYFAPSPVQELKSIPSPCLTPKSNQSPSLSPRSGPSPNLTPKSGLSPVMPRRNSNLECKNVDLKQSLLRESVANKLKSNKTKSFDMYNQQIDGAIDWKKPSKRELEKARSVDLIEVRSKKKKDDSPPEEIDLSNFEKLIEDPVLIERSPSKEYNKLFENEKLDEELSEMFEEFAAKVIPKPVEVKVVKKVVKKKSPPKVEVVESNLTYNKPAPKWCKKEVVDHNNVEAMCLATFSDKLMNEIKQLEQQIGENITNGKAEKSSLNERTNEKVKKPVPKKVIKKITKSVDGEGKVVTKKVVKKVEKNPEVPITPKQTIKPKLTKQEKSTEDMLFDEVCASNSVMDDINMLERTIYSVPSVERMRTKNDESAKNLNGSKTTDAKTISSMAQMKPLTSSVTQLPTTVKVAPTKPVRRNKSLSSGNSPDIPTRKNTLLGSMSKLYQTIKNAASPSSLTSPSTPKEEKQSLQPLIPSQGDVDVTDGVDVHQTNSTNGVSSTPLENIPPKPSTKILFRYKPITVVRCTTPPSMRKQIINLHKTPEKATLSSPISNGVEVNHHKVLERQLAVDNLNHKDYKSGNSMVNDTSNAPNPLPKHDSHIMSTETNYRHSNHEQKLNSLDNLTEQPKRYSLNYEDAVSSHYDNVAGVSARHQSPNRPEKPPRKTSATNERDRETDRLIERSQFIHNRKEEFMNAKLSGSNPYMKKVIDDERSDGLYGTSRSRDELRTDFYMKSRDEPKIREDVRKDIYYGRARDEHPIDRSYTDTYNHRYGSGSNLHFSSPYGSSTLTRQLSKQNSIQSAVPSNTSNSRMFNTSPSSTTSKYGLGLFNKKNSSQNPTSSKEHCTIS